MLRSLLALLLLLGCADPVESSTARPLSEVALLMCASDPAAPGAMICSGYLEAQGGRVYRMHRINQDGSITLQVPSGPGFREVPGSRELRVVRYATEVDEQLYAELREEFFQQS